MFKCAHISDVHFRSLKRHNEYRIVFTELFKDLKQRNVDSIFIGGDIVHSKTQGITPELIDILTWWFNSLSEIAETHVILGNHDGLMLNQSRQDAISPIINALGNDRIKLYKKSGTYTAFKNKNGKNINWCVFSCFDQEGWKNVKPVPDEINIACFHGAVRGSTTDVDWELEGEVDLSFFNDYDFTFLGDIHKRQKLDSEGRVVYPGSTIQQNYGEDLSKGYVLWEINNRYDFKTEFVKIDNPYPMLTVDWRDNLEKTIKFIDPIREKAKYRIRSEYSLSQGDIKFLHHYLKHEKLAKEIVYQVTGNNQQLVTSNKLTNNTLDIRKNADRKIILENYFHNEDEEFIDEINELFQTSLKEIPNCVVNDYEKRWSIKNIEFENIFAYGKDNYINFDKLKGLVGIFGPNRSGKSSIPGTLMYTLFNTTDRGSIKNKDIVNARKGSCKSVAEISVGSEIYQITRETIKRTSRNNEVTASTNLKLKKKSDISGLDIDETDEQRRETEKVLRDLIGSPDDFLYTAFSAQGEINAFVNEKSTARKAVLSKFLGLEVYEELSRLSREKFIYLKGKIKDLKEENWNLLIEQSNAKITKYNNDIVKLNKQLDELRKLEVQNRVFLNDLKNKSRVHPSGHDYSSAKLEIENISKSIDKIKQKKSEVEDRLKNSIVSLNKIENFKINFPINDLSQEKEKLEILKTKLEKLKIDNKNIRDEVKRNENEIKILNDVPCGDKFPTCKFIKNAISSKELLESKKFNDTINEVRTHISEIKEAIEKLNAKNINVNIKKYNDIVNKEYKLNVDVENFKVKIELYQKEIVSLEEKQEYLNNLLPELIEFDNNELNEKIEKIKTEINQILNSILNVSSDIQTQQRNIFYEENNIKETIARKDEFQRINKEWILYKKYSDAVNKKGIPTMLINSLLPIINTEINNILHGVTNFKIFIEDEEVGNNLNVFIDYGDSLRVIECCSGMEKMMASIAIRVALSNISNLSKSDIFIIDEGFGALDENNIKSCSNLLKSLTKYFKTVLIISHVDAIKDIVDKNLEITYNNKDSHVRYD